MASLKDTKSRIQSVKNTGQITKAMQMVSASKMQRAQDRAGAAIPYALGIYEIVNKIGKVSDYNSAYLRTPSEVKNIAIVVIGTSRGFVGSMITALISKTHTLADELKAKYPDAVIKGVSVHKTGLRILANTKLEVDSHFADYKESPTTTDLTSVFEYITQKFATEEYDQIHVVYTHFINTISQRAVSKQLLPLNLEDIREQAGQGSDAAQEIDKKKGEEKLTLFEPSVGEILDRLLPEYFQTQIYTSVLESIASEHSARMVAMKNATDNAKELQKNLNLQYNRQRQAGITQELIEIVSGSTS
jgi:F-type H+-transporting ATPase subunit gamma